MIGEVWLKTDELNESVKALEIVESFYLKLLHDVYYWKWVIITLHNSLQGFMVCALKGQDGLNVLKNTVDIKTAEEYKKGKKEYSIESLETYLNLYKKIKNEAMLISSKSKIFYPQGFVDRHVKKLNRLRNKFTHFIPGGWSLEVSDLPRLTNDCLSVIEFLAFDSNNISFPDTTLKTKLQTILVKLKTETHNLEKAYHQLDEGNDKESLALSI